MCIRDSLKRYQSVESRAVSKSALDLAQAQARGELFADVAATRAKFAVYEKDLFHIVVHH